MSSRSNPASLATRLLAAGCCAALALASLARADAPSVGDPEKGRALIADLGCAVCHTLRDTQTKIRKDAPDLTFEGDRVRPDWLYRFLREPERLRPAIKGRMPDFRLLEPEALALVEFVREGLRDASATVPPEYRFKPGAPGAAEGKKKAETYRCVQCHADAPRAPKVEANDLAPRLEQASRRLDPNWLFRWIRDPQELAPGVTMPSLFYSDGEANFDGADQVIADLRDYVIAPGETHRFPEYDEARKRYPEITAADGRRLMVALNCAGCHPVRSLPAAKPLAPSLVTEGSRVKGAWLASFLERPHVIKPEYGILSGGTRMPGFALEPGEAADIAAYMERALSDAESDAVIPPAASELRDLRERGRGIFYERRCTDCHRIHEEPGGIGPDLTRAGERLRYGWVYRFVQNPSAFLTTRMPDLNLTPDEARAVAAYVLGPKE